MTREELGKSWFIVCHHLIDDAKLRGNANRQWLKVCDENGKTMGYLCADCKEKGFEVENLEPLARESVETFLRGVQ